MAGVHILEFAFKGGRDDAKKIDRFFRGHTTGGREKELQRLDRIPPPEFNPSVGSQGSVLPRVFGPKNRVAGRVLWVSPPIDTRPSEGGGQWLRDVSMTVAAAASPEGALIEDIDKVWASNGKVIFQRPTDISLTGVDDYKVTEFESNGKRYARIDLWHPNEDISGLIIGSDVTFTGFVGGATRYNDTFTLAWAKDFGDSGFAGTDPGGTSRTWRGVMWLSLPDGFDWVDQRVVQEDPSDGDITIAQTLPEFRSGEMSGYNFLDGSPTQVLPDDTDFSYGGDGGNPSSLRGIAHIGVQLLRLNFFGLGDIPNLELNVVEKSTRTVGEVIDILMSEAGLPAGTYDASACTANLEGFVIPNRVPYSNSIAQLLDAYDLVVQDRNRVLTTVPRSSMTEVIVVAGDMDARLDGEAGNLVLQDLEIERPDTEINTPREAVVSFFDTGQDLQRGSVRARLNEMDPGFGPPAVPDVTDAFEVSFNIAMDNGDARAIAERVLREAQQSQHCTLRLPPSYVEVLEGDWLRVPAHDHNHQVEALKVTRGIGGQLLIDGRILERQVLSQSSITQTLLGPSLNNIILHPGATVICMDIPRLLKEQYRQFEGVLQLAFVGGPGMDWVGADLYTSIDGGTTWFRIWESPSSVPPQHTVGSVIGEKLEDGPVAYWDRMNTIDVTLQSSREEDGSFGTSLSDQSRLDVLNGNNQFLVGDEIIGCQNVTALGGNTFRLAGPLLRGLRGTEDFTGTHTNDEAVVLLDDPGREASEVIIPAGYIGSDMIFKAVPLGTDEADVDPGPTLTFEAISMTPYAVGHVNATRDPVDNLTVDWFRRTRLSYNLFGSMEFPAEDVQSFEVDVMSDATDSATVLRTIEVATEDAQDQYGRPYGEAVTTKGVITYTADEHLEDGLTPGSSVTFDIYQVGPRRGRGRVKKVTV